MHIFNNGKTVLLTNLWLQYFGGSEINCLSLAKALKAKGYVVEVGTLEAENPMLSEFMKENILVKNLLKEDLMRPHYDIIWAHHAIVVDYVIFTKKITADKIILSSLSPFEPYECLPGYANEVSLCLANSQETKQALLAEGIKDTKMRVFPNYVSAEWLCAGKPQEYGATPKKAAIVSNHVPGELLLAKDILAERGCEVDIYGLGHKVTLITPEVLRPYDLVITIGKTVQYTMALQIPVYCYDVHGGPGYLTSEELERTAFYNFSGRGFPKKNSQIIADDIFAQYAANLAMLPRLFDYVQNTSVLENNIDDVLSAVNQADNVNISNIRQVYAYRERSNRATLRLLQERANTDRTIRELDANCRDLVHQRELAQARIQELEESYETVARQYAQEQTARIQAQNIKLQEQNAAAARIRELEARCKTLTQQYEESQNNYKALERINRNLNNSYFQLELVHNQITTSRGWRMLNKYYRIRDRLFPKGSGIREFLKKIARLFFGKKSETAQQVVPAAQQSSDSHVVRTADGFELISTCKRIDILSVPHTAFIAKLLQNILQQAGVESKTHMSEPEQYEDIPYIMVCPQNFKRFPPVYIAFQMEQTINSRWLTDEYMEILHNAYAVFDYSLVNIGFFSKDPKLASKLYYLPVDVCQDMMLDDYHADAKECDVLFYGAPFVENRQRYLKPISEKFDLRVICDQFGPDLYREMNKAKILINIHYYENALLETTRLYETLSVSDCLIISERSGDPHEEAALEGIVDFVEPGNVDAMMARIEYWLSHEEERKAAVAKNRTTLQTRANAAKFFLNRFLLANDRVTFDDFYNSVGSYIHFDTDRICLSLPESTERRAAFDADNVYGFDVFPGLKHRMGWIGCGMSYKFMLRKAKEQQMDKILICEDDVYFPPDFQERFDHVLAYTKKNADWTVFSGIMADIGRVKPLKYVEDQGEEFIYLDKMISMVFNLYDKSIFETISSWDNTYRDVHKNTIDRYLESEDLRILTTCPFLVGHKEDLNSTIWGQQNTIYTELIANSSVKLRKMVDDFKKQLGIQTEN